MLKRLRWKFTAGATTAVLIVLLILVGGINLAYRHISVGGTDRMLQMIASNEGRVPEYAADASLRVPLGFRMTPETPFETRFFIVRPGLGGEPVSAQTDFIAAVSEEEAEYYYLEADASGAEKGTVGHYRFLRSGSGDSVAYVFLDISRQQQTFQDLLLISLLITFAGLCLTLLLAWLLSGIAIRPTARSIENQKRFITDASHEMKTPLTVIRSCADILCMDDEKNEWAEGIRRESKRLTKLVSDLVLLSRWDEEAPVREKRLFDLSRAVWDTLTPYRNLAEAKGKTIDAEIADGLSLRGDESAVQTALSTLLENAVQYSAPDSVITLRAGRTKRGVRLTLSNACTLDETLDVGRLFERFYCADPSRSRDSGGTGVGLSIAKAIVEAHDGKISAARETDGRLTFQILFPAP